MARLFVALWPPEVVLDAIAALPRPVVPGVRWTTRDQWHATLLFLGEADGDDAAAALARAPFGPEVEAALGPATDHFADRIAHVPVRGIDGLAAAAAQTFPAVDARPFVGHVTLARVRNRARVRLGPVTGVPIAATWTVAAVHLVESRLHPHGARYETVATFPLR